MVTTRAASETIAVTGANGFVGRALVTTAVRRGLAVRPLVRSATPELPNAAVVGDLAMSEKLSEALVGTRTVVHLAARAHVTRERSKNPLELYWRANVLASKRIAQAAVDAGVRRIVFLSSVKVNGEGTARDIPFSASDDPCPAGPYGQTKWEAERELRKIADAHGLELVIIRSPLVYGGGAGANIAALVGAVRRGIPLPFAEIDNRRSLVGLNNLVDLLLLAATRSADGVYFASDDDDVSTPELIRRITTSLGLPSRLFAVPASMLSAACKVPRIGPSIGRLVGNLQVDVKTTRATLGWTPPFTMHQEIAEMLCDHSSQ